MNTRNETHFPFDEFYFEEDPSMALTCRQQCLQSSMNFEYYTQLISIFDDELICAERIQLLPRNFYTNVPNRDELLDYSYIDSFIVSAPRGRGRKPNPTTRVARRGGRKKSTTKTSSVTVSTQNKESSRDERKLRGILKRFEQMEEKQKKDKMDDEEEEEEEEEENTSTDEEDSEDTKKRKRPPRVKRTRKRAKKEKKNTLDLLAAVSSDFDKESKNGKHEDETSEDSDVKPEPKKEIKKEDETTKMGKPELFQYLQSFVVNWEPEKLPMKKKMLFLHQTESTAPVQKGEVKSEPKKEEPIKTEEKKPVPPPIQIPKTANSPAKLIKTPDDKIPKRKLIKQSESPLPKEGEAKEKPKEEGGEKAYKIPKKKPEVSKLSIEEYKKRQQEKASPLTPKPSPLKSGQTTPTTPSTPISSPLNPTMQRQGVTSQAAVQQSQAAVQQSQAIQQSQVVHQPTMKTQTPPLPQSPQVAPQMSQQSLIGKSPSINAPPVSIPHSITPPNQERILPKPPSLPIPANQEPRLVLENWCKQHNLQPPYFKTLSRSNMNFVVEVVLPFLGNWSTANKIPSRNEPTAANEASIRAIEHLCDLYEEQQNKSNKHPGMDPNYKSNYYGGRFYQTPPPGMQPRQMESSTNVPPMYVNNQRYLQRPTWRQDLPPPGRYGEFRPPPGYPPGHYYPYHDRRPPPPPNDSRWSPREYHQRGRRYGDQRDSHRY